MAFQFNYESISEQLKLKLLSVWKVLETRSFSVTKYVPKSPMKGF